MKNKKRILIIISDYLFVRNYISTKVFKKMSKKYKVKFLINDKIDLKKRDFDSYNFKKFQYNEKDKKNFYNIFRRKIWQNVNKSNSFKFKLKIYLQFNRYFDDETFLSKILKFPIRLLSFLRNYFIYFYDTSIMTFFLRKVEESKLPINKSLFNEIKKFDPNLIIFPTNTINQSKYDLYKITKKIDYKILYLVDNWDNLSSKSTLFNKKSLFTVWGEQTANHARKIQNIPKEKIQILGTPRFESYFKLRNLKINSFFKFKYILFLESTLPSESKILPILDKIISNNVKFKGLKIIYRPHPWRKSLKIYKEKDFKNIIIDPQAKKNYLKKNFSSLVQPPLNYYPSLIKNAEFIISGPTSMIVESLIFRKSILLLNFKLKNFLLSPYNILKNFEHFKGIDKSSGIIKNRDLSNLEADLLKCFQNRKKISYKKVDLHRDYFLTEKCKNYKNNLNILINKILK